MVQSGSRIFFSVGDHSGDLHGANLIEHIRELSPDTVCEGFGGEHMAQSGCQLLYPLCQLAVTGFAKAISHLPAFVRLRRMAVRHFQEHRPEAVVLIDYPGFNWWMARAAKKLGIPVYYFVPPQLWAWGGWRARKMRKLVDHVLCTLPFERDWYRERQISSSFVGHPYFDEIRQQQLDEQFMQKQSSLEGTVIGLLPGSRRQELEGNLAILISSACYIHQQAPNTRFIVACRAPKDAALVSQQMANLGTISPDPDRPLFRMKGSSQYVPVEICTGKTPEVIQVAHSCITVSGSVSLELLYRTTPSVILYKLSRLQNALSKVLLQCRYITLVNLLVDQELFPEHFSTSIDPEVLGKHVLQWLENPKEHERLTEDLARLRERVAIPGACKRAAEILLHRIRKDVPRNEAA